MLTLGGLGPDPFAPQPHCLHLCSGHWPQLPGLGHTWLGGLELQSNDSFSLLSPLMLPKGHLYCVVILPGHHSERLWPSLPDLCHYLQPVRAGDIIAHVSLNLVNQRAVKYTPKITGIQKSPSSVKLPAAQRPYPNSFHLLMPSNT